MITHVVLFKLKPGSEELLASAAGVLRGLVGKVPSLRALEVGIDVVHGARSYDIALIATFDDMDGLESYRTHPEHIKVVEYIEGVKESSVAVDFHS